MARNYSQREEVIGTGHMGFVSSEALGIADLDIVDTEYWEVVERVDCMIGCRVNLKAADCNFVHTVAERGSIHMVELEHPAEVN
jgi:hypothetical protein